MATQFTHRLHLIASAAVVDPINTFIKQTIDPAGDPWLTLGLSPTGDPPFTHAQFSAALTKDQYDSLQAFLLSLPITREGEPEVTVVTDPNTGEWTDPADTLEDAGLKPPNAPIEPPADQSAKLSGKDPKYLKQERRPKA